MSSTTLLVLSLEAWDDVWRRNQYLFDGLLRTDDQLTVVFVEPSRDLLHDSLHLRVPARGRGLRQAAGYEGRLFLYQPTKWLPRILGPFADLFMRAALHRNLCRAGLRPDLMWLNDPGWYGIVERASLPTIYDITDDWLAAARTRREHRRIVRADASLLKSCTSVVVCSEALRKSRRHARDDIILIPNAVDVARYQTPAERPDDFPDRDIALYVGTLHEDRLDVDLVARTGSTLAAIGSACVLLGPNALSASNTSILANTPGVILLGPRSWDTVPGYLQHAAALIVPHIVSHLLTASTRSSSTNIWLSDVRLSVLQSRGSGTVSRTTISMWPHATRSRTRSRDALHATVPTGATLTFPTGAIESARSLACSLEVFNTQT